MSPQVFSVISIFLNLVLCSGILFRQYKQGLAVLLFLAAMLFPLLPLTGIHLLSLGTDAFYIRLLFLEILVAVVIFSNISMCFMRKNVLLVQCCGWKFPATWLLYGAGAVSTIVLFSAPWEHFIGENGIILIEFKALELCFITLLLGLSMYGLYQIESTYRFAMDFQRRVGHLCFFSFLVLWVFTLFFIGRILLYHILDLKWFYIMLSVFGVVYPIMLLGFFRYRLGFENVSINRNSVYTSIVITIGGVVFSGVGLFAYVFRFFNIDRSYFEKALFIVAFIASAIVVIGSGSIRRWIIEFVSSRFYSTKYDYREQFFHLYKTYVSGTSLDESLTSMVENMKYAVAAIDAFVFWKSRHNNSYVMHRNPEYSTAERVVILGNEFPDSVFWGDCAPLYLQKNTETKREKLAQVMDIPFIKKLSPTVIFPIHNEKELLGLLMIKLTEGRVLEQEDIALINVFTHSIGMVFYRNILANEKIKQEQFQSFHQVVSFVIHDIKNQIATLSLLARNATEYITDQDFQKSLIRSIKNSAENLTTLVTKLTEQHNAVKLKINETTLIPIVESAIEQSNLLLLPEIELKWELKEECNVSVDTDIMKSIVLNVIKNGIEAMSLKGKLTVSVGKITSFDPRCLERFGLAHGELSEGKALLVIEDTGSGMSQEFIDNGLFKPFVSTKDKGMGIGLYQCKVSVERMGGKIYCYSRRGEGTAFCVMV